MKSNQTLHLAITPSRKLSEIQMEFNQLFPYLKLEFFSPDRVGTEHKLSKKPLESHRNIADAQKKPASITLDIHSGLKVKELERMFRDQLFLTAEVFRCSGNLWLQTTHTDDWTLEQQNNHGKEITAGPEKKDIVENDYDLSRDSDD